MDWKPIYDAVVGGIIPIAVLLCKGLFAASTVGTLAGFTIRWVYAPWAEGMRTSAVPVDPSVEIHQRIATLFVSMLAVGAMHASSWPYDFGAGPKGWGACLLCGFLSYGVGQGLLKRFGPKLESANILPTWDGPKP